MLEQCWSGKNTWSVKQEYTLCILLACMILIHHFINFAIWTAKTKKISHAALAGQESVSARKQALLSADAKKSAAGMRATQLKLSAKVLLRKPQVLMCYLLLSIPWVKRSYIYIYRYKYIKREIWPTHVNSTWSHVHFFSIISSRIECLRDMETLENDGQFWQHGMQVESHHKRCMNMLELQQFAPICNAMCP